MLRSDPYRFFKGIKRRRKRRNMTQPKVEPDEAVEATAMKDLEVASSSDSSNEDIKPRAPSEAHLREQPEFFNLSNLDRLMSEGSEAQLQAGTQIGLEILRSLAAPINDMKISTQVDKLLKTVADLEELSQRPRVTVAVLGSTGAGKSSTINAVLDEGRIVPTSGCRACTAVITEISYNDAADPNQLYRAEIEFVSLDDWRRELTTLFNDLVDSDRQLSRDYMNPETDAGVAYAKLKAVYPQQAETEEMLAGCDPNALVSDPDVCSILGTVSTIGTADHEDMYSQLRKFLESRERSTASRKEKKGLVFWPLIKVVRVYIKSDILSTGLVLVDLVSVSRLRRRPPFQS